MLKKCLLVGMLAFCSFPSQAQTYLEKVNRVLERAYAAQNVSAAQEGKKQWQLALFLAARNRSIEETLSEIQSQITLGNVSVAAVLDMDPDGVVPEKKCACSGNACSEKSPSAPLKITLYVLYRSSNGLPRVEKTPLPLSADTARLWQTLLAGLKKAQSRYYTGLLIDAHSSGSRFLYGEQSSFTSQDLMQSLANAQMHVDFMELQSCHISSLLNQYRWARSGRVDYVAASSDVSYSSNSFMYYRFLRFLDKTPQQAAVASVQDRAKLFAFSPNYNTNNVAVIAVKKLQAPLDEYIRLYKELLTYEGSEETIKAFEGFFQAEYSDWRSLKEIVRRQKQYVLSQMDPELYALYETQQQFAAACDKLLSALDQATLSQWCYSRRDNRLYTGVPPAGDCLDSVSVNSSQFWDIWR